MLMFSLGICMLAFLLAALAAVSLLEPGLWWLRIFLAEPSICELQMVTCLHVLYTVDRDLEFTPTCCIVLKALRHCLPPSA